ncbi:MAG: prolyl-tRNA synthetase associated domain-containing protein [Vulcanimicrobiota bacterium]
MDIYAFLSQHSIAYARHDHPPVYTCEQADQLVPPMAAARTKNLFLRNRKGSRHFLVVVGYEKSADLKALAPLLEVDKLSMGTPERMLEFLGVEPGSVTILGLANDCQGRVEVVFDLPIAEADSLRCHPLVNTATLEISAQDIRRFLVVTGHQLRVLDVPGRA